MGGSLGTMLIKARKSYFIDSFLSGKYKMGIKHFLAWVKTRVVHVQALVRCLTFEGGIVKTSKVS